MADELKKCARCGHTMSGAACPVCTPQQPDADPDATIRNLDEEATVLTATPRLGLNPAATAALPGRQLTPMGPPPDDISLIGKTFGHCKVLTQIGHGGMGAVYKAYHLTLEQEVVMKVLPLQYTASAELVQRFLQEARSCAKLHHQNVVQILDVGHEHNTYYYLMEYVDGCSLEQLIHKQGKCEPYQAARIIQQAAQGLAVAHRQGIIHRDIKAANIMLTKEGEAKVTDFGLARDLGNARISRTGQVMGTPHYMSPEQADGQEIDGRSDLYSLGITFYYLLAGKLPFEAPSTIALLKMHCLSSPKPLRQVNPEVPVALEAIVAHLLAKKPEQRYQSANELVADLERFRKGEIPLVLRNRIRRRRLYFLSVGGVISLLLLLLAGILWLLKPGSSLAGRSTPLVPPSTAVAGGQQPSGNSGSSNHNPSSSTDNPDQHGVLSPPVQQHGQPAGPSQSPKPGRPVVASQSAGQSGSGTVASAHHPSASQHLPDNQGGAGCNRGPSPSPLRVPQASASADKTTPRLPDKNAGAQSGRANANAAVAAQAHSNTEADQAKPLALPGLKLTSPPHNALIHWPLNITGQLTGDWRAEMTISLRICEEHGQEYVTCAFPIGGSSFSFIVQKHNGQLVVKEPRSKQIWPLAHAMVDGYYRISVSVCYHRQQGHVASRRVLLDRTPPRLRLLGLPSQAVLYEKHQGRQIQLKVAAKDQLSGIARVMLHTSEKRVPLKFNGKVYQVVMPLSWGRQRYSLHAYDRADNQQIIQGSLSLVPRGMVRVPAGRLILGGRPVTFKSFYIDQTEVTNAAYRRFIQAINYPKPPRFRPRSQKEWQRIPVTFVSYHDAREYARWMHKRLPTEVEWIAAALWDGQHKRLYPWGNELPKRFRWCWRLRKVRSWSLDCSFWQVYDLAGNVAEWVTKSTHWAAIKGCSIDTRRVKRFLKVLGQPANPVYQHARPGDKVFQGSKYCWLGFRCALAEDR